MSELFITSDSHFGHGKTCTHFKRDDGTPLRPFSGAEEMDEELVKRWNAVVRPNDKVYHLGDVAIGKKSLPILNRLNGKKKLVMANHDIFHADVYREYFYDLCAVKKLDKIVLTHIPIHVDSLERYGTNVHGHLHAKEVLMSYKPGFFLRKRRIIDPRYLCVSVEHTDYAPVTLDEVRRRIAARVEACPVKFKEFVRAQRPG